MPAGLGRLSGSEPALDRSRLRGKPTTAPGGAAQAPQAPLPEEEAAVDGRLRLMTISCWQITGTILVAAILVTWPTDLVAFRNWPRAPATYAFMRATEMLLASAVVLLLRFSPAIRRRPEVLVTTVGLLMAATATWCMAEIGDLDGPWFSYLLALPLLTIALLVRFPARAAATALECLVIAGVWFGRRPQDLHHPGAATQVVQLVFYAAISLVAGVALFRVVRAGELARLRLARAGLAGGTSADENWRLAREIHDELGQDLAAMRYSVASARERLAAGPTAALEALDETDVLLARAASAVRRVLTGLTRFRVEEQGLESAVRSLVDDTRRHSGLQIDLTVETEGPPPVAQTSRAVFRVLQEALTNVQLHARAHGVRVSLAVRDGAVHLEVADDGIGLAHVAEPGLHVGLAGIRERAQELGGEAVWGAGPAGGMRLEVSIPPAPGRVAETAPPEAP